MERVVYTIGHSNHTAEVLIGLLAQHRVGVVADVRSRPYSRYCPQFDRERLKETLRGAGIGYVFLGAELGARSEIPSCYERGKVKYDRVAKTQAFQDGLARVEKGAAEFRVALLCAEKEPGECHRTILVARELERHGLEIRHVLADGTLATQSDVMKELMKELGFREDIGHLFRSDEDRLAEAYELQEARIAYEMSSDADEAVAT
jgi:uncharacterized protein (DUF488 family)